MYISRTPLIFLIFGMILCIWLIHGSAFCTKYDDKSHTGTFEENINPKIYRSPEELAPCGEVCTYGGREVLSGADTKSTNPQLEKAIDCQNIMSRMAYRNHDIVNPPPENPPEELLDQYTMNGDAVIGNMYKDNMNDHDRIHYSNKVENFVKKVLENQGVSPYAEGNCVQDTMRKYSSRIAGKHGVVIGTHGPWVEAIAIAYNASMVTTLEYNNLTIIHPKIQVHTPYDFGDMYLQGRAPQFDFGVTFSSLEHSGLGRYGDPLNPYGDLEAMAQIWCMIKPGGMLAIGVPGGENEIVWNVHRIYGNSRLAQLTANWQVDEVVKCADIHTFIVLTKPT